jgi:hypothetical protein
MQRPGYKVCDCNQSKECTEIHQPRILLNESILSGRRARPNLARDVIGCGLVTLRCAAGAIASTRGMMASSLHFSWLIYDLEWRYIVRWPAQSKV